MASSQQHDSTLLSLSRGLDSQLDAVGGGGSSGEDVDVPAPPVESRGKDATTPALASPPDSTPPLRQQDEQRCVDVVPDAQPCVDVVPDERACVNDVVGGDAGCVPPHDVVHDHVPEDQIPMLPDPPKSPQKNEERVIDHAVPAGAVELGADSFALFLDKLQQLYSFEPGFQALQNTLLSTREINSQVSSSRARQYSTAEVG